MADYSVRTPSITVPANGAVNYPIDFAVTHGSAFTRVPHVLESVEGSSTVNATHTTDPAQPDKVTWTIRNSFGAAQVVRLCVRVTDAYHQA